MTRAKKQVHHTLIVKSLSIKKWQSTSFLSTIFISLIFILTLYLGSTFSAFASLKAPILTNKMLFETYSIEKGLSQVTINDIVEDKHGFIWVATQSGLNRFDGYSFISYKNTKSSTSLSSNFLTDLLIDTTGNLWIGTQLTGISVFNEKTGQFQHHKHDPNNEETLSGNFVNAIMQDSRGNIWVATNQGGLDLWQSNTNSFKRYNISHPILKSLNVQDIAEVSGGIIWLATDRGLYIFDVEQEKLFNTNFESLLGNIKNIERSRSILSMHAISDEQVYLGTNGGLFLVEFDLKEFFNGIVKISVDKNFNIKTAQNVEVSQLTINDVLSDRNGDLHLATQTVGLCRLTSNSKDITCEQADNSDKMSLKSNSLRKLYFDKFDQLWVGTSASGLSKYIEISRNFVTVRDIAGVEDTLKGKIVFALHEKDGKAWAGTLTQGITEFDLETGKANYYIADPTTDDSILENGVVGLHKENNHLWIGYRNVSGLTRLNLDTQDYKHFQFYDKDQTSPLRVRQILPSKSGKFMLSGPGSGLIVFDPENSSYKTYRNNSHNPNLLPTNDIVAMDEGYGYIWLATSKGLVKFDERLLTFESIPIQNADNYETANYLYSVRAGKSQDIWLGSQQGLHRYDLHTKSYSTYRAEDGLPNEDVDSILIDHLGDLWMSTNNGLAYFNTKNHTFESYFEEDGTQHNEYAVGAAYTGESGRYYFGGVNGFTIFDPKNFKRLDRNLTASITSLHIANREVKLDSTLGKEVLVYPIHMLESIELSYKQASLISFGFSALDYLAPGRVEFQYRMLGVIEDWVPIESDRRSISFTGLNHGNYNLQIRARYQGSLWPDNYRELSVNIMPPFWKTWWAYTIYILLTVIYINSLYQRQRRKLKEKEEINIRLEALVEESTKELKDKNVEVMKMVEKEKESNLEISKNLETIIQQKQKLEVMMEKLKDTQKELVQKEKMASLGSLVAGIAHEVNTPVGICVTSISHLRKRYELLQSKIADESADDEDLCEFLVDVEESCKIIGSNTEKAAEIIQSFKRIAVDQSSEDIRNLEVKDYLGEILLSMKPILKRYSHNIKINCPHGIQINTVAGAFSQVMTNLINNSLIHAFKEGEQGEITINVSENEGSSGVHIKYSDNGMGMDQNQLDNYFEPFFTTKRSSGGSGLGGHLIYNLVLNKLGGSISIESKPNEGTVANIELPTL